jgi:hypothetical protein
MQKHEMTELAQRLSQLADALDGKAPTAAGLLVWLDTLGEVPKADVLAALTDWPKSNGKMPRPNDVLKMARERTSDRVEKRAADNAKDNYKPWSPQHLRASTAVAKSHLPTIKEMIAKPRRGRGKEWATRILGGEFENAVDYAQQLAKKLKGAPVRTETEADIEARLEREAMQSEGLP